MQTETITKNRFDRLEIEIPTRAIKIIDENAFHIDLLEGFIEKYSYFQNEPFFYRVCFRPAYMTSFVEFSGKALLNYYPELIHSGNLNACINNINKQGICSLDYDLILQKGVVTSCDVTCDIQTKVTVKEIYNNISIKKNRNYSITDINKNMFAIVSNNVTKNKKSRLVVYGKGTEIQKAKNKSFRQTVTNCEEQLQYFEDKIRLELNLNSKDRIRHYFKIDSETLLTEVLNSIEDPIKQFLSDSIAEDHSLSSVKKESNNIKELGQLLVLMYHNFDISEVEKTLREISGRGTKITEKMIPFIKLRDRIKFQPMDNLDAIYLAEMRKHLVRMVIRISGLPDNIQPSNLLSIYTQFENDSISCTNGWINQNLKNEESNLYSTVLTDMFNNDRSGNLEVGNPDINREAWYITQLFTPPT